MKKLHTIDRATGLLDAQLNSSTTAGSFTLSGLSLLGSQDWDSPAGEQAIITFEDEQILGTMAESAGTLTFTIATNGRGYNGTSAATHLAETVGYIRMTSAHYEILKDEVVSHVAGLIIYDGVNPTVTSALILSVAGSDETARFTVGRVVLVKISGTWHRCVVRSSSFSTNTTINVTSDTLPGSGTITDVGFEMRESVNKPVDLQLIKEASAVPASNPPAGYIWLFAKAKGWFAKDSDGKVRFMSKVRATAASAAGTLALDWSVANVYDVTLTENITTTTHSNGVEGEEYVLRVLQHASSPKTVVLAGKTRYSNSIPSFSMTQTNGVYDIATFYYNATDDKYDIIDLVQGVQTTPVAVIAPITMNITTGEAIDGSSTPQAVCIKASDGLLYKADANDATLNMAVGFVTTNALISTSTPVVIAGVVSGFTGLTQNATYYVSDTAGATSPTQSTTCAIPVGKAISTTQILVGLGKRVASGSITHASAATGTQDVTTTIGFRATKITLGVSAAITGSTSDGKTRATLVYMGTTQISKGAFNEDDASGFAITTANVVDYICDPGTAGVGAYARSSGGNRAEIAVTLNSITNTTFVTRIVNSLAAGAGGNSSGTITFIAEE